MKTPLSKILPSFSIRCPRGAVVKRKITAILIASQLLAFLCSATVIPTVELATDGPRARIDLNGQWQTLPIKGLDFQYPPPTAGWQPVPVPIRDSPSIKAVGGAYDLGIGSHFDKDGNFKRTEDIAAWFQYEFQLPNQIPAGHRALLKFNGMSFKSETWFNGKKIGTSITGQLPLEYDVTDLIKPGAPNTILVGLTEREGIIDQKAKVFLAPPWGATPSIWGEVEMRFVPAVHIDDVFVKTSVKNKTIELETTLVNQSNAPHTVTLHAMITDSYQVPQTNIAGSSVTLAAGETKIVTLKKDWIAPALWSYQNPNLYFAHVDAGENNALVDRQTERFGFREFEIRGRDFYLNGKRVQLLRNSCLTDLAQPKSNFFQGFRSGVGKPFNCYRLHIGFSPKAALDSADEIGIMLIPESPWKNGDDNEIAHADLWLDNAVAFTKGWIKLNRNHPSVIIWSLCNETLWGQTDPARMAVAEKIFEAAKSMDDTRPFQGDAEVTWNNRLPIINVHYPENEIINALRAKYPSSGLVFPNDFHWLSSDPKVENESWRAKFKWDRPLIIGEYWCPSGEPDYQSSFMGESVYDMLKWRSQEFSGRGGRSDNEFSLALQRMTDVYRMQGVAGVNPWSGDANLTMPVVGLHPLDFNPNFQGGTTGKRKIVIFNDAERGFGNMKVHSRLIINGVSVEEKVLPIYIAPGTFQTFDITFACPQVASQTAATLSISMSWDGDYDQWWQNLRTDEQVFILPKENLGNVAASKIVLLDSSGSTAKALDVLGLTIKPASTLTAAGLKSIKTLIIGDNTDATPFKDLIASFVQGGGSVVLLHQDQSSSLVPELPDVDAQHVTTRSWKRVFEHPIVAGVDDKQLSYWLPDNLVATKTFRKSTLGSVRNIIDSGGAYGMGWSPLVEVPFGLGTFVVSQMPLVERVNVEPMAAHLLAQSIRYAMGFTPIKRSNLRLLATKNEALLAALQSSSIPFTQGLKGQGPVLLDASYTPTSAEIKQMKDYLEKGGKVWLHGFTTPTLARIAGLLPFTPQLVKADPTMTMAARRSTDPLISNLSSFDFAWAKLDVGGDDYITGGKATASLGAEVLQLPAVQTGEYLIEPAFLVKVPVGKGGVLFDSLAWEQALGTEPEKVARIISSLANNLGGKVQLTGEHKTYQYSFVDLSQQANMSYYDPVANDGKGGWTDDGENDMRFFLTNHTGKDGGREGGMEVAVAEFPAKMEFNNLPFALVQPKKNNNRAVISLRGGEHGKLMPDSAQNIAVNHKANQLWFLQAAGWAPPEPNQEVARYVIHYDDNTQEIFPVRWGLEVGDWWAPHPLPHAKVAWAGNNLVHAPVGIYSTSWTNPHPEKTIKSIDIVGNLSPTQFVVIAITLGLEDTSAGGNKATKTTSLWNLEDLADHRVPNRIPGGEGLQADSKLEPVAVTKDNVRALRFSNGQCLWGHTPKTADLNPEGLFSLNVTFEAESKPSGYCGGIYEAMEYGKKGFRLTLGQDMKIGAEIFPKDHPPTYVGSKAPLEIGKFYDVTLKFDGKFASLFLDGKLCAMVESPPPALYEGGIRVGVAGGKDYFFNGLIQRICITVPQ